MSVEVLDGATILHFVEDKEAFHVSICDRFDYLDADRDGLLSYTEMLRELQSLRVLETHFGIDVKPDPSELAKVYGSLFDQFDHDSNGTVDLEEFEAETKMMMLAMASGLGVRFGSFWLSDEELFRSVEEFKSLSTSRKPQERHKVTGTTRKRMSDSEENEEYQRIMLEKPRTLQALLAKRNKLNMLQKGGKENPIVIGDPEEDQEEDPEEDPEEYPEESEPVDEEIEIREEPNIRKTEVQQENEVIEDSPECKRYFEEFGSIKRKRNMIRPRPIRPRSCKKEQDLPFASKVVIKPLGLVIEEMGTASINKKLRNELKRLV
ncbi:hypothetical protein FNV43_RR13270 [Rhamnella rubrinervis]|uniref:EF-hand domain-containing protein n=1 Tax=Rhamnella rubrinervis TaxID=2594499 RepID=A0A8K0H0R3_9ROSA|nr:hypothetical protein FNV43_RR13270 [Rhamnella rubrinervis]